MVLSLKKGFTLIELLIAISVIGILSAVMMASFTTGQKRGRDAKRRADLSAVQQSLEQCFAVNSVYPETAAVSFGSALACGTQTTMNQLPLDPKNSGSYVYGYTATAAADGYCLCALLEQAAGGNAAAAGAAGVCNFNGGDYLCLSGQQ